MKKIIQITILTLTFAVLCNSIFAQSLTCAGASAATLTENATQGGTVTLGPFSNAAQSEFAFSPWTETAGDVAPSGWNNGGTACAGMQAAVGQPVFFEFTPLFTAVYNFNVPGLTSVTNAQGNDVNDAFCTSSVMDTEFAIFTGTCGSLTEVYSVDDYGPAGACNAGGGCGEAKLTAGVTYTIAIDGATYITSTGGTGVCATDYSTSGTSAGSFNIEITSGLPGRTCAEDNITLTVGSACSTTTFSSGPTCIASSGAASCAATFDDVAWFSFMANATDADIMVASGGDQVLAVFDGCGGTELDCSDGSGTTETLNLTGLTIGNIYFIEVYDFGTGTLTNNTICVTSSAIPSCATCIDPACNTNPVYTDFGTSEILYAGDCWSTASPAATNSNSTIVTADVAGTETVCTDFDVSTVTDFVGFDQCISFLNQDGVANFQGPGFTFNTAIYQEVGGACVQLVPTNINTYGLPEFDNNVTAGTTPGDPGSYDPTIPITLCYTYTSDGTGAAGDDDVQGNIPVAYGCTAVTGLVAGTPSSCNPTDNTYSVDITVSIANLPAGGGTTEDREININGQTFTMTATTNTFTLTGLTADAASVDVTAFMSVSTACTFASNALFTAPANCTPVCEADNGTWAP